MIAATSAAPMTLNPIAQNQYIRLHIRPLDASLLPVIVPASVLPLARNISYHTIETFPENRFGYLELPTAHAERLKTKLNGAILKGVKLHVTKAKEKTWEKQITMGKKEDKVGGEKEKVPKLRGSETESKSESRKRKQLFDAEEVLEGVELQDRKVKRGWTDAEEPRLRRDRKKKDLMAKENANEKENKKDKVKKGTDEKTKHKSKSKSKSKYTDGPELLFKAQLTPTAATTKSLDEGGKASKKGKKKSRSVVVHEFEHTTKFPTFLKPNVSTIQKPVAEFIEGKGWVDADGNIVEQPPPSKAKRSVPSLDETPPSPKRTKTSKEQDEDTSSAESGNDGPRDEEQRSVSSKTKRKADGKCEAVAGAEAENRLKISKSTDTGSEIARTEPHPFELLFKRTDGLVPNDTTTTTATASNENSFSFFGHTGDFDLSDVSEGEAQTEPHRPQESNNNSDDPDSRPVCTQPVPKKISAHSDSNPHLRRSNSTPGNPTTTNTETVTGYNDFQPTINHYDDDEAEAEVEDTTIETGGAPNGGGSSIFRQQFYAKRDELSRSWRDIRKLARKEKRSRENKSEPRRHF